MITKFPYGDRILMAKYFREAADRMQYYKRTTPIVVGGIFHQIYKVTELEPDVVYDEMCDVVDFIKNNESRKVAFPHSNSFDENRLNRAIFLDMCAFYCEGEINL